MTSRERIIAAFRLEKPDRVPVSPFGLGHLDPEGPAARELIEKTDPFISAGLGADPFFGRGLESDSSTEGEVTRTVYHTPRGELIRVRRRTTVTSATTDFPCHNADDIEKLLSIPYEPPDPNVDGFMQWKRRVGEQAMVLAGIGDAVCVPATWWSPEDFALLWADARDELIRLVQVMADRLNAYIDRACRLGVDAYRIVGGEYASVQLGPEAFDRLVRRPDTELVQIMHQHGAWAYFHNHGPMKRYLDACADIGIDALDPLEGPPWGDCDLAYCKAQIGDRTCLVGNLDDMEVVERLDTQTVCELGRQCLEAAGPVGYCLGGTASGTYTERAARNFIALVDVAREFSLKTV